MLELIYEIFAESWIKHLDKKGIANEKKKRVRYALFIILGMVLGLGLLVAIVFIIILAFPNLPELIPGI